MIEIKEAVGEPVDKSSENEQPIQASDSVQTKDDTDLDETDLEDEVIESSKNNPTANEAPVQDKSEQMEGSVSKSVDDDKEIGNKDRTAAQIPTTEDDNRERTDTHILVTDESPTSTVQNQEEDPLMKFEKLFDIMSKENVGSKKEVPEGENLGTEASGLKTPEETDIKDDIKDELKKDSDGTEPDKEVADTKVEVPDVTQSEQHSAGEVVQTEGDIKTDEKNIDIDPNAGEKVAEISGTNVEMEIPVDRWFKQQAGADMVEGGIPKTTEDNSINVQNRADVEGTEADMRTGDDKEPADIKQPETETAEFEKLDSPVQQTLDQLIDENIPATRELMDDSHLKPQVVETEESKGHEVTKEAKHATDDDEEEDDDERDHHDEREKDADKDVELPSEGLFWCDR